MFEVVAEGEVAQHLKEGTMAGRLSYIFYIAGTDTLLAGGHPFAGRDLLACEIRLQWSHAGIDQQKAVVIVGNQRKAVHNKMSLALKEIKKHFSQFVNTILFQNLILPVCSIRITTERVSREKSPEHPVRFIDLLIVRKSLRKLLPGTYDRGSYLRRLSLPQLLRQTR